MVTRKVSSLLGIAIPQWEGNLDYGIVLSLSLVSLLLSYLNLIIVILFFLNFICIPFFSSYLFVFAENTLLCDVVSLNFSHHRESNMRIFRKIIVVVLLLFFLFSAPSTAEIISKKLRSDNRSTILFSEFGFSHTGHVSFDISSVSVNSNLPEPDPSRIGFFLLSFKVEDDYLQESRKNLELCPLDNNFISLLFTFQDHVYPYPQSSFNKTYPVSYPVYTPSTSSTATTNPR